MNSRVIRFVVGVTVAITILVFQVIASDNPSPSDLVAKHLDSIGKLEDRKANTLRTGKGTATLDVLSGGSGHMAGTSTVASMGKQFNFLMFFNAPGYMGEQFKFDGDKVTVADNDQVRYQRRNLGLFMYQHDVILKEGLWGGVWNAAWPLYDLKARSAELKYEGTKNVDGKRLLEYRYIPRHAERELTVHLLFEPDAFRHVRTIYEVNGPIGNLPAITVTEAFDDFRDEKGLMLPHSWNIRFDPDQIATTMLLWKVNLSDVMVMTAKAAAELQAARKK